MEDNLIPKDLQNMYDDANNLRVVFKPIGRSITARLIERIGHAEKTVESQQSLLDKYDADNTALVQENAKLKSRIDALPHEPFDTAEDFIRNLVEENTSFTKTINQQRVENAALKSRGDQITRGGCGKPGHTTCIGDEGTAYCLTCELEHENVTLKTQLAGAVIERNRLTDAINQRLAAVESGPLVDGDDPDVVLRDLVDHVAGFSQAALMIRVRELEEQLKGHYASPCIGYPDCDGDLIGYEHSSKCIAARLAEKMVTMPELKLLKTNPKKRAAILRGIHQIIEIDEGVCGQTQDALDMLDDLETMSGRENLLVDALRSLTQVSREPLKSNYTLRSLWVDAHNDWQYAHDLVAQFDAEEHQ